MRVHTDSTHSQLKDMPLKRFKGEHNNDADITTLASKGHNVFYRQVTGSTDSHSMQCYFEVMNFRSKLHKHGLLQNVPCGWI